MKPRTISLLPGDLIGRDLAGPVTELLAKAGAEVEWQWLEVSGASSDQSDGPVKEAWIENIRATGVALRCPFRTPVAVGYESPSVQLRRRLDLYAGVRRCKNLAGIPSRYPDLDLVVIRENTEDVYAGLEHVVHPGVVESLKVVSREKSERIMRFGFRYARSTGRRRVAIIHKANIMKKSDGLFLKTGLEVAQDYPDVDSRGLIVDNTCMQLVQNPYQFDVLICGNLYGDIISDLAAGLVGGISTVWGMDQGDDCVVFEQIHGRVPELMGQDVANPLPLLIPAIQLLNHIGQGVVAERLQKGVEKVIAEKTWVTRDLGGKGKTSEMLKAIGDALA